MRHGAVPFHVQLSRKTLDAIRINAVRLFKHKTYRTAVALCRASTPSRSRFAERNATLYQPLANGWKQLRRVDARHKAGHDGGWKSLELVLMEISSCHRNST
jgi:hypothetical protein